MTENKSQIVKDIENLIALIRCGASQFVAMSDVEIIELDKITDTSPSEEANHINKNAVIQALEEIIRGY